MLGRETRRKGGRGGGFLSVYKRPSSPSSNWVDPTGHNWAGGANGKANSQNPAQTLALYWIRLDLEQPEMGHMLNVALHPLDHPELEGCSRKSAMPATPFHQILPFCILITLCM